MDAPLASILLRKQQSDSYFFSAFDGQAHEIESIFHEAAFAEPYCLVVKDAGKDNRFKDHPSVLSAGVRFAAAVPINGFDGGRLGTLAVYDFAARGFNASQKKDLTYFAKLISSQVGLLRVIDLDSTIVQSANESMEAIYTQDLNGRILEANSSFELATGYSRSSLIGMNCNKLLAPQSAAALQQLFVSILGGEVAYPIELTFVHREGQPITLEVRLRLNFGMGKPSSLLCVARDITERIQRETGLQQISEAISSVTGEAFFHSLAENLAQFLGVKYVLAGELSAGFPQRIRTLAASKDGAPMANFDYEVADTPWERVIQGEFSFHPSGTSGLFKNAPLLERMGIESFMGMPLRSSQGTVIGLLSIMDTVEWTPNRRSEAAVRIFALRAASELERRMDERERLRLSNLVENTSDLVVLLSLSGEVQYLNKSARDICGPGSSEANEVKHYLQRQLEDSFAEIRFGTPALSGTGALEYCVKLRHVLTGESIPIEFAASLLKNPSDGEPESIAMFGRDLRRHIAASLALREADRQYLTTISTAADGIIMRMADGNIAACNASARRIMGVSDLHIFNEVLYKRWLWFREDGSQLDFDDHPSAIALRTGVDQAATVIGFTRQDGVRVWLSVTSFPLMRPGESKPYGVISSFSDVSQTREFNAGLKQLHRLASAHYNSGEDIFQDFLRTGCEMFGLPHGFISELSAGNIVIRHAESSLDACQPGSSIPYAESFCSVVLEQNATVAVEDTERESKYVVPRIFREAGIRSYFGTSVLLAENVYGVIGFFSLEPKPADFFSRQRHEILELMARSLGRVILEEKIRESRMRAEEELRRSEHLFRSIIENTSDFVCILDSNRNLKYASPSIARTFALTSGPLQGMSMQDLADAADREQLKEQERIWLSLPGPHPPFELRVNQPGGGIIHLECVATNLLSDPGIAGVVISGRDITERKMAQILEWDRNNVLEKIARSGPPHEIFREIAQMVERQQPGLRAAILLLRRGQLVWESAPGFPGDCMASFPRITVNPHAGFYAMAAYSRQPHTVMDVRLDPFWRARKHLAAEIRIGACMALPIVSAGARVESASGARVERASGGQVLGVFAAHFEAGVDINDRHRNLMNTAVSIAAVSMEHNLLNDQLSYQSRNDALTGLPNRLQLQERLPIAIEKARAQGKMLAVCVVDLDRFKQINDSLGHAMGDRLLKQVGLRFHHCAKQGWLLARMGGDEFAVVLTGLSGSEEALARAEELLSCLRAPFVVDEHELFVTSSMGIGMFPADGRDVASLLRNADSAMHMAKHKGNDSLEFFKPDPGANALRTLEMETYLRRAIENNELQILFQPQVDLDGRVDSMEALVKWDHPKLGRIPPSQFIPIAEESGMIAPIGAWVLRQACLQNAAWQAAGLRPIRVGVNVSAMQFARPDFVETVAGALLEAGLNPRYLDLELTESILIRNLEESIARMAILRKVGVSISIDDFGTGYSSLSYLRRLPADTLKIDQSFLRDSTFDSGTPAVFQTIVSLAHNLGLSVVAEGVETAAQLELVRAAGCDKAQGHYFGEAVTPEVVPLLLSESWPR